MFEVDKVTGDITLTQGDSGIYTITGLPTDEEYTACFAIQTDKRKPVGSEVYTTPIDGSASFDIQDTLTNLLTVKPIEETATYYGGIKLCGPNGYERTYRVGNKEDGERIIITVYPKQVEGKYLKD